jgi:hypothetical protein
MINKFPIYRIILFISVTAVVGLLVFRIIPQAIVGWDEASYLERIYLFARGFKTRDLSAINIFLSTQPGKPPLQEFLFAPILYFTGFSIDLTRRLGMIWLIISVLFAYKITILNNIRFKLPESGLFTAFFILTSPLFLYLSSTSMREGMGAAWSIMCMMICTRDLYRMTVPRRILLGIMLFLLSMIKLQYGIVLSGAVGLEILFSFFAQRRNIRELGEALTVFIPDLFFGMLYSFFPLTRLNDIIFTLNDPWNTMVLLKSMYQIIMYYPLGLIYTFSLTPLIGVILICSVIYAVIRNQNQIIRIMFFYIIFQIILGIMHSNNMQERYLAVAFPSVAILAGTGLSAFIFDIRKYLPRKLRHIFAGGAIIFLIAAIIIPAVKIPDKISAVASYVSKTPVFLQRDFGHEIWFDYNPDTWPHDVPWGTEDNPDSLIRKTAQLMDLSKPVNLAGDANEFSQPYKQLIFDMVRQSGGYPKLPHKSYVSIFDISPTSVFYTLDYQNKNLWKVQQAYSLINSDPEYFLYRTVESKTLGVRSIIYAKN